MGERMRVVITGARGMIGTILVNRLDPARFDLVAVGREEADITVLPELRRAVDGAAAIVHLAAEARVRADWSDVVGPNLIGAYNVYEAARQAGVRRVVFASSNHAVGMYLHDDERFADADRPEIVSTAAPLRPDSLYGATKAWGEALGRLYAERHGLEVVCLRIGWVTHDDEPPLPGTITEPVDAETRRRGRGMWLSHRDCAALVVASLTAEVRWAVVHGVSDNRGRWLSLEEGRALLGWAPVDGLR
jgi:nucleoside-diphosphate-sugar epimerase